MGPRPRVGISACLLGQEVRWNGEHRREPWLVEVLGERVEWVPVCPELEVGLGVPREPIRLVGDPRAPRLVGERSGRDHTEAMLRFAEQRVRALAQLGLSGYVTKRDSPSCGLRGVPVHPAGPPGPAIEAGTGLFVRVLRARMPDLIVEDEVRLRDPSARDAFVARVLGARASTR
jgi:uncharacterized protein YbbK (DUF523 family)